MWHNCNNIWSWFFKLGKRFRIKSALARENDALYKWSLKAVFVLKNCLCNSWICETKYSESMKFLINRYVTWGKIASYYCQLNITCYNEVGCQIREFQTKILKQKNKKIKKKGSIFHTSQHMNTDIHKKGSGCSCV